MQNLYAKDIRVKGYEIALIKVATFTFGIWLGMNWPGVFAEFETVLLIVFAVSGLYASLTMWKRIF